MIPKKTYLMFCLSFEPYPNVHIHIHRTWFEKHPMLFSFWFCFCLFACFCFVLFHFKPINPPSIFFSVYANFLSQINKYTHSLLLETSSSQSSLINKKVPESWYSFWFFIFIELITRLITKDQRALILTLFSETV